jgi:hypothetical protein
VRCSSRAAAVLLQLPTLLVPEVHALLVCVQLLLVMLFTA